MIHGPDEARLAERTTLLEDTMSSRTRASLLVLSITLVTFITFAPSLLNGFVAWDDDRNLVNNLHYRGLDWQRIRWMLAPNVFGHWIPLTWLTFAFDYLVWGMNPFGYHLSNVVLHATSSALFYPVAWRLLHAGTPSLRPAALHVGAVFSALFFALHPLRAESVAWVTERRDVLAGAFCLLTVLAYLRMVEAEGAARRRWLAASVACYALAAGAKPTVITVPVVLAIVDVYPLRRLPASWTSWGRLPARNIWLEKVPFFAIALAAAALTLYGYSAAGSLTSRASVPLVLRGAVAVYGAGFYVLKTVFPVDLAPLYELPGVVRSLPAPFMMSAVGVGVTTAAAWLVRRWWPAGIAAWLAYLVLLFPASGLIQSGPQLVADRYTYLPCLVWALMLGSALAIVVTSAGTGRLAPFLVRMLGVTAAVWIAGLTLLTWQQVQIWRDNETLWRYAVTVEPECAICQGQLGIELVKQGRDAAAIDHLQRALARRPDDGPLYATLGLALLHSGRPADAIGNLEAALERRPDDVTVRESLGAALLITGRPEKAAEHFEQVLRTDPARADTLTNLGLVLNAQGKPAEAVAYFRRAIAARPRATIAYIGLVRAYLALGNTAAAREELEALRRIDASLASQAFGDGVPSAR